MAKKTNGGGKGQDPFRDPVQRVASKNGERGKAKAPTKTEASGHGQDAHRRHEPQDQDRGQGQDPDQRACQGKAAICRYNFYVALGNACLANSFLLTLPM